MAIHDTCQFKSNYPIDEVSRVFTVCKNKEKRVHASLAYMIVTQQIYLLCVFSPSLCTTLCFATKSHLRSLFSFQIFHVKSTLSTLQAKIKRWGMLVSRQMLCFLYKTSRMRVTAIKHWPANIHETATSQSPYPSLQGPVA